jgi:NAD(P)-dependent dehydrogenase (short-subunit alcohol dehydrogenase family)
LEKLNKNGATKILAVATDLKVEAQVTNLFQQVNNTFGRAADVVIANAGMLSDSKLLAEDSVANWWNVWVCPFASHTIARSDANGKQEINVLGLHNTVTGWIKSQPDPKNPVGTVIDVNSGLAGMIVPGNSAYSISKLATHRYMEFVDTGEHTFHIFLQCLKLIFLLEYPGIRSFTLLPGIVPTDMSSKAEFVMYARDEAEQTGALSLYLASSRGDYLKGSLTSVNWDLEEMEEKKGDIEKGELKMKWVSVLPTSGGTGW